MDEKYRIRFFFDYGGSCFWGADSKTTAVFESPITPDKLPLSTETIDQARDLINLFEDSLDWGNPGEGIRWNQDECDRFNTAAGLLFEEVKKELGESFELMNKQKTLKPGA